MADNTLLEQVREFMAENQELLDDPDILFQTLQQIFQESEPLNRALGEEVSNRALEVEVLSLDVVDGIQKRKLTPKQTQARGLTHRKACDEAEEAIALLRELARFCLRTSRLLYEVADEEQRQILEDQGLTREHLDEMASHPELAPDEDTVSVPPQAPASDVAATTKAYVAANRIDKSSNKPSLWRRLFG